MPILTGPQCRAARALIQLTASQVARKAGVPAKAILDFEKGRADPDDDVKRALCAALEEGGAVLIRENGGGVGVRLKYSRRDVRMVRKWEGEGGSVADDDA